MKREFDEVVADSMKWFTDGVDVPDGLAAQARGHVRRQRRTRMGWLAGGTAVAAAAAVLVGTVAAGSVPATSGVHHSAAQGGSAAHGVTVQTTAVVISRVDHALAKAASGHPVAFTRQAMRGISLFVLIPHGKPIHVRGNVTKTWSRGPLQHEEVVGRAGKVSFSMQTDLSSGKSVQTMVSYPQKVWWNGTFDAPATTKPTPACTLGEEDLTTAQWTREVRKLLSCGAAVAGFEQVDGVKTIKLKLSSTYKRACVASNYQSTCAPQPVGWNGVLWANATTFLPVRLVSHGHQFSTRTDFRWLAPTRASLAELHQPIPAGFRHV